MWSVNIFGKCSRVLYRCHLQGFDLELGLSESCFSDKARDLSPIYYFTYILLTEMDPCLFQKASVKSFNIFLTEANFNLFHDDECMLHVIYPTEFFVLARKVLRICNCMMCFTTIPRGSSCKYIRWFAFKQLPAILYVNMPGDSFSGHS